MKLRLILREATTPWMGPIEVILGSGEPYTLNYGTGVPGRPPMLYVHVPLSWLRRTVKLINRDPVAATGSKIGELTHVGEAHVTVSMGPELQKALGEDPEGRFKELGLFDRAGAGIAVTVRHTGDYKVMRAAFYKDEADPQGPTLVGEVVEVPLMAKIRETLGLPAMPQIPGIANYIPHVTVGYAPELNLINRSYVQRHGSVPRNRKVSV